MRKRRRKMRRMRRRSDILAINDHDTEVVKSFKYLQTVKNNTKEETEEIKARILTANKAHFIHSIAMCRMQRFLAILRSFFNSSLLCTFSCHASPPTIHPSSLTSYYHLFLGPPLSLVVPKFIYNTLLGILFPSILCTCPNQRNLLILTVSIIVGFLTLT